MEKHKDFKINQKVRIYDPEDDCFYFGKVLDVYASGIVVQWEDIIDPVRHIVNEDEFNKIKIVD